MFCITPLSGLNLPEIKPWYDKLIVLIVYQKLVVLIDKFYYFFPLVNLFKFYVKLNVVT